MHESMFVKRNENGGNDVGLTGHTPFFFLCHTLGNGLKMLV